MKELNLLHVVLIYLAVINVVTFFMFGIDKWKAKKSKWRIRETALLGLAVLGGSIGAWLGMKVWHHKTQHKKFRYGVPLILIAQIALFLFCSCRTASLPASPSSQIEQSNISQVADKIWAFSQSHPNGFTLDLRTMTEPTKGIAVSYAATQNSHSRNQLDKLVNHAFQNNGYVGGWYNKDNGLYYFDSTRLFPEDSLQAAIRFGKENGQQSVYVISSSTEIPIMQVLDQRSLATEGTQELSPNVFLVMYDAEIGKDSLLKAIEDYKCEIKYDYSIINGMALKKPDNRTLEETMQYFKKVKGVTNVEYDHVYRLTDPVKPKLELK
ncbi:MAG: DUF1294 domain-containing protein [Prevotella sp.]|nr:DUF1294 domain-containing protein [Prevotella sp.]